MTRSSLRLAFVLQDLSNGMLYHEAIIDALEKVGVETRMIVAKPPRDGSLGSQNIGFLRIKLLPSGRGRDRTISIISPRMIRQVVKAHADIIICVEYSLATLWGIIAGKISGSPVVIYQEHYAPTSRARGIWRRLMRRFADHYIANSDEALKQLSSQTSPGQSTQVSMPVPPEFDLEHIEPFSPDFEPQGVRFLFAGRFVTLKNIEAIVEAATILRHQGHAFSVLLVGDGPEKEAIAKSVADRGLADVVRLVGRVDYDQMASIYRWCDVFIMPTWDDYRSVAVLEAMRAGKPIIDSLNDGNAGDSVRDNYNGILFDPSSTEELAAAMTNFILRPDSILKMGARSAEYMATRTPAIAAARLKQMSSRLLGTPVSPPGP